VPDVLHDDAILNLSCDQMHRQNIFTNLFLKTLFLCIKVSKYGARER
jgi:hypothetical protein